MSCKNCGKSVPEKKVRSKRTPVQKSEEISPKTQADTTLGTANAAFMDNTAPVAGESFSDVFPPQKLETRVFHLGLNMRGQQSLCSALATIGPYASFDWQDFRRKNKDNASMFNWVLYNIKKHKPMFLFMQIQNSTAFTPQQIQYLIDACPKGVRVFNFSGDVNPDVIPWYVEVSKIMNVCTAFTDMDSVKAVKSTGECARYLPIGYEEDIFHPMPPQLVNSPEIVFFGSLYPKFPLHNLRIEMMSMLKKKYGNKVAVFGGGWDRQTQFYPNAFPAQPFVKTSAVMSSAKVIIGINNYNIARYTSDRMFNSCASGTPYVPQYFEGIEELYENGVHILHWETPEQLLENVEILLGDEKFRVGMGAAAAEHTHKNHRWINRINTIREWMEV